MPAPADEVGRDLAGQPGAMRLGGTGSDFAAALGTQAIVVLFNISTGALTAWLLGPAGRGEFAAVSLWPHFLALVALGGLPYAVIHRVRGLPRDEARAATGAAVIFAAPLAVAAVAVGVLVIPIALAGQYEPRIIAMAQLFALVAVANLYNLLLRSVLSAFGHIGLLNLITCIEQVVQLATLVTLAGTTVLTPELAALSLFVSTSLALAIMAWQVAKLCRPRFSFAVVADQFRPLASYAARASGAGVLSNMAQYTDRLVLVVMVPPAELAAYVVAFALSRILVSMLRGALDTVALPAMSGVGTAAAVTLHDRLFRLTVSAGLAGLLFAPLVDRPAITLLYGPAFEPAVWLFRVLLLEATLSCLCEVSGHLILARGRPGFTSTAQAVSFAVMLAAILPLVHAQGALGAALAMVLGSAVRLAILWSGLPRILGVELPSLLPRREDFVALAHFVKRP